MRLVLVANILLLLAMSVVLEAMTDIVKSNKKIENDMRDMLIIEDRAIGILETLKRSCVVLPHSP